MNGSAGRKTSMKAIEDMINESAGKIKNCIILHDYIGATKKIYELNDFYFHLDFHEERLYILVANSLFKLGEIDMVYELSIEAMRRDAKSSIPMMYYTIVDYIYGSCHDNSQFKYADVGATLLALFKKYPIEEKIVGEIIMLHAMNGRGDFPEISSIIEMELAKLAKKHKPDEVREGTNSSSEICRIIREEHKYLQ